MAALLHDLVPTSPERVLYFSMLALWSSSGIGFFAAGIGIGFSWGRR